MEITAMLPPTSDLPTIHSDSNLSWVRRFTGPKKQRMSLNWCTSESTLVYNHVIWKDLPLMLIKNRINVIKAALVDKDDDEFLEVQIYENAEFALNSLERYLHLLDADEVGPSQHGTLFMNFEREGKSLVLEIGNNTVGIVFMNNTGNLITLSESIENNRFWEDVRAILSDKF
jgi:hypothetical protein